MSEVKIGDVIKALDFAGRDDCYMIGKVVAFLDNGQVYNCKAITKVWAGVAEVVPNNFDFSAPKEGVHFMDERFPGRITVVA